MRHLARFSRIFSLNVMNRHGLLALIGWTICVPTPGAAQQVYWLQSTFSAPMVRRANPDGSGQISVPLPPEMLPQAIAIDRAAGQLYITSRRFNGAHVYKGSTFLSGFDTLAGPLSTLRGIALDPSWGMLYTTSTNLVEGSKIRRTDLKGLSQQTLFAFPSGGRESLRGIALDLLNRKLYWADFGLGKIRRGDLNGGAQQDIASGLQGPVGVALDSVNGKLYWSEANAGTIKRSNLDGTSTTTLVTGASGAQYIDLDLKRGMIYWTEVRAHGLGLIRKSTLDGNNVTTILGSLASDSVWYPQGLALLDTATVTSVAQMIVPLACELKQNYPNPFNPSTTIRFGMPQRAHVTLAVYNTLGQQVAQLVDGEIEVGYHDVKFDASNLPSGVYFCRLQAGTFVETRKLCLVR